MTAGSKPLGTPRLKTNDFSENQRPRQTRRSGCGQEEDCDGGLISEMGRDLEKEGCGTTFSKFFFYGRPSDNASTPPKITQQDEPDRVASCVRAAVHKSHPLFTLLGRRDWDEKAGNQTWLSMPAGFWSELHPLEP
jgi:hypothetical protein